MQRRASRVLVIIVMALVGLAGAAPAAAAAEHHSLCTLAVEEMGPPTDPDPCVDAEPPDEIGTFEPGLPWPGPCEDGFRLELHYTQHGVQYGVCVPA